MDTNWILVIVLWGGLVGVIIACFFPEFRKTPDQRKAEVQKARERAIKKREEKRNHGRKQRIMLLQKAACRAPLNLAL